MIRNLLIAVVVVAVPILVAWGLDVFTLTGLGAAFWPGTDTTGLLWPLGTRLVWWLGLLEAGVAVVSALDLRDGRLEYPTVRDLWMAAHVSLVRRLHRRAVFAVEGLKVAVEQAKRHRPTVVEQPVVAADEVHDATSEERAA